MTANEARLRMVPAEQPAEFMHALVYLGPGKRSFLERPKPRIQQATDAVVRVSTTTICGTDLHILHGDVPSATPGRILGHEGIGIIDTIGEGVTRFKPGDRVLISCITADGTCSYCRKAMYSHCENGGWILGNTIDGTQADFVRIPFADTSLYRLPDQVKDEEALMLSDILPTAFECGVLNGRVSPSDSVAIIGAGPIGLAALITAQFYSPSQLIMIDMDASRLELSKRFGSTNQINNSKTDPVSEIMKITGNRGVDVAMEAVGMPQTFELCEKIIAPGGRIANIGVHGKEVVLHLEKLWDRNVSITTRLVDAQTTPMLLNLLASGKLDVSGLITHHFKLPDMMKAYDTFGKAAQARALKVVISA